MDRTEAKEDLEKKWPNPEDEQGDSGNQQNSGENVKSASETAVADGDAEEIAKLKEELEGAKDKYIRLYSEFENFRKRTAREKLELIQSANEQLIMTLLPVVDDFERAENSHPDKNNKDLAGFFLIHAKLKKALEVYGVSAMETAPGSDFNPDFHEAISQVETPVAEYKGKIVDVVEKGYLLKDKVIRYAKVVVGN